MSQVKILPTLTNNYNNSIHSNTQVTPNEAVNLPAKVLKERLEKNSIKIKEPNEKYSIGDRLHLRLRNENKFDYF